MAETETPLLYTSLGNIPFDGLTHSPKWEFTENSITYIEEYYLGEELVKRSAAVFCLPPGCIFQALMPDGQAMSIFQGNLNG